jgi:hypothetical protein
VTDLELAPTARPSLEPPRLELQTLGHATLVLFEDGRPLLATDPWLVGSVYWRSWWLERYPTAEELDLIASTRYLYVTHSHPDHFHPPSLRRLGRPHTLHPTLPHYRVPDYLRSEGFPADLLQPFRRYSLTDQVVVTSIPCFLDDSILIIETPNATVIDVNDANPSGQLLRFLHDTLEPKPVVIVLKSYSPASSAVGTYRNGFRTPLREKRDYVRRAEEISAMLDATHYVPFASQAFFSRQDSLWANEHKVTYEDLVEHWTSSSIKLCRPFARVDLGTGTFSEDETSKTLSLESEQHEKIQVREKEEADFSLPDDFPERLAEYLDGVRLLRLVCRRGIGFQLTTSGEHWFYDVWNRTVDQRSPGRADFVISLPDKVLYEALLNGILTDLGITMLIRVDTQVDVRRSYAVFSLMALRDYGYFRPLRNLLKGVMFYIPVVFPNLRQSRIVARLRKPPVGLPKSRGEPYSSHSGPA